MPPGLDYDAWLGPAPWAEYHEQRCHYQFRFILDYSGGQVTNFGAHHLDIVQWALGMDGSGPCRAWGKGDFDLLLESVLLPAAPCNYGCPMRFGLNGPAAWRSR